MTDNKYSTVPKIDLLFKSNKAMIWVCFKCVLKDKLNNTTSITSLYFLNI